jgi:hypothetical protein
MLTNETNLAISKNSTLRPLGTLGVVELLESGM